MEQTWEIEKFSQTPPGYDLDRISGRQEWKLLFRGCSPDEVLQEEFLLPAGRRFLLCGSGGAGKGTLARAFAGSLMRRGYRFFVFYADELEGPEKEETVRRVRCLLEEAERGKTVMLLERLELLRDLTGARLLSRGLQELGQRNLPFVCLATAETGEEVLPELLCCFDICRLEPPDEEERASYFEDQLSSRFSCEPDLDSPTMAKLTEGFTYGQMAQTAAYVRTMLCGQGQSRYRYSGSVLATMKNMLTVTRELFERGVFLAGEHERLLRKTDQTAGAGTEPGTDGENASSQDKTAPDRAPQPVRPGKTVSDRDSQPVRLGNAESANSIAETVLVILQRIAEGMTPSPGYIPQTAGYGSQMAQMSQAAPQAADSADMRNGAGKQEAMMRAIETIPEDASIRDTINMLPDPDDI